MKAGHILFLAQTLLLAGCIGNRLTDKRGRQLTGDEIVIPHSNNHQLKLMYTGCGGMVIGNDSTAILLDPYYTGHNEGHVLTKIKPDPKNARRVFETAEKHFPSPIEAVLITHAHYDHLEDLPWVLDSSEKARGAKVVASPTASFTARNHIKPSQYINPQDHLYRQCPGNQHTGKWIDLSPHARTLVIESDHAPHWHSLHFMRCKKCNGKKCCKHQPCSLPESNLPCGGKDCEPRLTLNSTNDKTKPFRWKEGSTYAYLIDFFTDTDTLRIFVQTSASNPPYGFPPAAEIAKKKVDIAVLCVASYQWVSNYPEAILSLLKPEHTVLIHWENFFRPLYGNNRTVPGSNLKKFMRRMKKYYQVDSINDLRKSIVMARPLRVIKIRY